MSEHIDTEPPEPRFLRYDPRSGTDHSLTAEEVREAERWYPIDGSEGFRLKRRADALRRRLADAQDIARTYAHLASDLATPRLAREQDASKLLQEHGVRPTDRLRTARARRWNWRVYRDPQDR